jgi:NO-binding membrane sensor protein with MHYT domain
MTGYYNLYLVILSIAIAVIASYTALDLANRVSESEGNVRKTWLWLIAGATSLGTGIWAMHFIGMLAFHLPIPVAYDLALTGLSMLIAVAVSAIALFVLRQRHVTLNGRLTAAALMGAGIAAMHYTGMTAMRMSPGIAYDPLLFITSILIALGASLAALTIALRLRHDVSRFAIAAKLASAVIMGLAITGMHYTGMAAAEFAPGAICRAALGSGGLSNALLAVVIGGIAAGILALTLVLSTLDGHFAVRNARLADSLRVAKEEAESALLENRRINEQLRTAQTELVGAARRAGMAEIANNVLHNIGNVLNSVNVSAGLIQSRLRESKLTGLGQALDMMDQHRDTLGDFLVNDEKGRRLPGYLRKVQDSLQGDARETSAELAAMIRSIEHIKEIVRTQQSYSGSTQVLEPVDVGALIVDALRMAMSDQARERIQIRREIAVAEAVMLDKHATLQILINLFSNARHALEGMADAAIFIRAAIEQEALHLSVRDTGEGICAENLPKLFVHGFTTRKSGHGYGLHGSALAAKSMGGSLTAASDGPGQGATFSLMIPVQIAVERSRAHA